MPSGTPARENSAPSNFQYKLPIRWTVTTKKKEKKELTYLSDEQSQEIETIQRQNKDIKKEKHKKLNEKSSSLTWSQCRQCKDWSSWNPRISSMPWIAPNFETPKCLSRICTWRFSMANSRSDGQGLDDDGYLLYQFHSPKSTLLSRTVALSQINVATSISPQRWHWPHALSIDTP